MPPRQEVMASKPELKIKDAGSNGNQSGIGQMTKRLVTTGKEVILTDSTRKLFYNLLTLLLTLGLILSVSVFTYGSFYFAYMPSEVHEEDVNFQFTPCVSSTGLCSFPNATLFLDPKKHRLMIGQPYRIQVMIEVPDSTANQELGMFMSCLKVLDTNRQVTRTSCKSSILEFRSSLLRVMETILFSPFLVLGTATQRQWIIINYFDDFLDNPSAPASLVVVELQSQFIQVYSAKLQVHAKLSGLRHIMYHHPWISSISGIIANIIVLTTIILISSTRFLMTNKGFAEEKLAMSPMHKVGEERDEQVKIKGTAEHHHRRQVEIIK